ncbi:thioester-containing protein 1 allele R1-like, partial [Musca vetustissima]|uniref:thioester-containing protein 1 allele R1-like n=1 Tax=Musca vetustissima TaxID=27455 RepID=UPI002AB69FCF
MTHILQIFFVIITLRLGLVFGDQSHYSIIAPGTLKSNRKYSVVVTLHNATEPATIRCGIIGPSYNQTENIVLQPFESQQIDFMPTKLIRGTHMFYAEGLNGLSFKNETLLYVEENAGPKIYIQTDKAIYKPLDLVQFRVVVLDEHTRPLNVTEPIRVEIMDANENRVKQFKDISLIHGVFTNKFNLSEYPALGIWKIAVFISGKYGHSHSKTFKVKKYILPKFYVTIENEPSVTPANPIVHLKFYGKYNFGKFVEGIATVRATDTLGNLITPEQKVNVNGIETLDIEIKNFEKYMIYKSITLYVQITEKHSGRSESTFSFVNVQQQEYNVIVESSDIDFKDGKPYRLKIKVQQWNGTAVRDPSEPVYMIHGERTYQSQLNDDGVAVFDFEHNSEEKHIFKYRDSLAMLPNIYNADDAVDNNNNKEDFCKLTLLSGSPQLGKMIEIKVSSLKNIPYIVYTVTGHGNIIQTEFIKIPSEQKSYIIQLMPTIEMMPAAYLYVHYIYEGNYRYEEMFLKFPNEFENKVEISAPHEVRPGQNVTINIKAQPNSYVCLLAVDLGVYNLNREYDLDRTQILNELRDDLTYSPLKTKELTALTLEIPDTITTWRMTAFSIHNKSGFGIVDDATNIVTIKPFFVDINLPYAVKRGEMITLPITVFNYHNKSLSVEVQMYNEEEAFRFKAGDMKKQIEHVKLPANGIDSVAFTITPQMVGNIKLQIRATTSEDLSDAVLHYLKVEPEGTENSDNQVLVLRISAAQNELFSNLSLNVPPNIVVDSEYITLSMGGDALAATMENLNGLVMKPTGCGEQNMVNFAPNILLLQYLKAIGKFGQEKNLIKQAKAFVEIGYQQELSFRHASGGYSVFGERRDKDAASTWLTAYVIRFFLKAATFVSIEEKIITSGLDYLASNQKADGDFAYTGYLFYPAQQNRFGFTAFVLMTFMENKKYSKKYTATINKGLQFLSNNLERDHDVYALSIIAAAFGMAKHVDSPKDRDKLLAKVNDKDKQRWWSANDKNGEKDVEITAYALLALLDISPHEYHSAIFQWLMQQRNSKGGFQSTHDTVMGLQAIVKYSQLNAANGNNQQMALRYAALDGKGNEVKADDFAINGDNNLILHTHKLPRSTRSVNFKATGSGQTMLQLSSLYYMAEQMPMQHFRIQAKAQFMNLQELNVEICFTYLETISSANSKSDDKTSFSNMVIMKLNLPSGYRTDAEFSQSLLENELIQRIESMNSESSLNIYFDNLEAGDENCIIILADKTHDVMNRKPVAIEIYYSVVAPGTIKSNRNYTVCLTLHNAPASSTVRITLMGQPQFTFVENIEIQPFETKSINFLPPKLDTSLEYRLEVEAIKGLSFYNASILKSDEMDNLKIYTQTDKSIYKPGDVVQFRVVVLDEHLRPFKSVEPIQIEVV